MPRAGSALDTGHGVTAAVVMLVRTFGRAL